MHHRKAGIVGATSSMAQPLIRKLANLGIDLVLLARDAEELSSLKSDIEVRHAVSVKTIKADFADPKIDMQNLAKAIGNIDLLLIFIGVMGNESYEDIAAITRINYILPAELAYIFASQFAKLDDEVEQPSIVIISSVAGNRGRKKNFIYGSSKAALTTFASGLRAKFTNKDIHIMTVRPGFIDTPLTYGMSSPLITSRDKAAELIVSAIEKRKDDIYVPGWFRFIMWVIMSIPEKIFKRLSI